MVMTKQGTTFWVVMQSMRGFKIEQEGKEKKPDSWTLLEGSKEKEVEFEEKLEEVRVITRGHNKPEQKPDVMLS